MGMTYHRLPRIARAMLMLLGIGLLFNSSPALALMAAGRAAPDVPTFSAPANYIVHGIHLNPVSTYPSEISNFENRVGKQVGILMYFRPWDWPSNVNNVGPCDDGF